MKISSNHNYIGKTTHTINEAHSEIKKEVSNQKKFINTPLNVKDFSDIISKIDSQDNLDIDKLENIKNELKESPVTATKLADKLIEVLKTSGKLIK